MKIKWDNKCKELTKIPGTYLMPKQYWFFEITGVSLPNAIHILYHQYFPTSAATAAYVKTGTWFNSFWLQSWNVPSLLLLLCITLPFPKRGVCMCMWVCCKCIVCVYLRENISLCVQSCPKKRHSQCATYLVVSF